jgi:hypothetical protein
VVAAVLVLVLLGLFLYGLLDSRSQARSDLEKRFDDRAQVSAALVRAIFGVSESATIPLASKQFGGDRIDSKAIADLVKQNQWKYAEILDESGKRLAAGPGVVPDNSKDAHVQGALATGKAVLSDLQVEPSGKGGVVEWAVPFPAKDGGRRVEVVGFNEKLIASFLNTFLAKIPQVESGQSYVVDANAYQLGGPTAGSRLTDKQLLNAAVKRKKGKYDGHYFTSAPIEGSNWVVLLTTSQHQLYKPVSGSRETVQWLIFAAFLLTAIVGLFLLYRVASAQAEIERRKINQHHAMEINDNIIQRLVLAKYALDRGSQEMSHEKLAETLEEAQRLVSGLLEEHPTAGSLRRREAADTGDDGGGSPPASGH